MAHDRDRWLALADTVKQVALADEGERAGPEAPRGVRLGALAIKKSARAGDGEERPDSAVREIPSSLNPTDPRSESEPLPPLEVEYDLD